MRALVAAGFALVLAMQVLFIVNAGDRPFPYVPVQILSAAGTVILLFGAVTGTPVALAVGFGVNALARIVQIAFGLSRLHLLLNLALAAGWVWACVAAARGRPMRGAVWLLAFTHAASLLYVLGRFEASIALALGATGLFLAAPHVDDR